MKPQVNKKYIINCQDHTGEAICTSDQIFDAVTNEPIYYAFEFQASPDAVFRTLVKEDQIEREIVLEEDSTT